VPPRVLMFCPQFRPIVGGAERQAEKLSIALVRMGAKVTILTPRLIDGTPLCEEQSGVIIRRFPFSDLSLLVRGMRGIGPINLAWIRWQVLRAVGKHVSSADIVHTHIAAPLTAFAMEAAHNAHVPALCKVAMAGDRTDLGELASIGLGGPGLARRMVARMDHWVATTNAVKQSLTEWGVPGASIASIPNGVDVIAGPSRQMGRFARRFLYLGRLSSNAQRDVPTLVRAFDAVADKVAGAELAVVGGGDLLAETRATAAQMKHAASIILPGEAAPERWMNWADCFVLPSRREGLSNALLEAMSNGLACIANDIPQNREVLGPGEAGILVPVGDETALVQAMLHVAEREGAAEDMGNRARTTVVNHYSIESVAMRYLSLYADMIASAAGSRA
jgi:glycosyltransferase involved in cell wall biosynthesis